MLGRQKHTQQNQQCLSQVPLKLSWLMRSLKVTNHQVLIIKEGGRTIRNEIQKKYHFDME